MRLASLLCCLVACGVTGQTLEVGGRTRSYILHVPAHTSGRVPLVIALHGGGSRAAGAQRLTKLDQIADREGFIVVYPESADGHWNDGRIDPSIPADVDDVAFIRTLIDTLAAEYPIDTARVFATGISNGGMMAYRLACELSDKIAAIAPVAGAVAGDLAPRCQPARPVSVIAMNGTADPLVPWEGGQVHGVRDRGAVLGARASVALFAQVARCGAPVTAWEPDRDRLDGTRVQDVTYGGCDRAAVELVNIDGGGHTWPGGAQYLPVAWIGRASREFSASERIWRFFAEHGR